MTCWGQGYRIADVDVDLQARTRGREPAVEVDADAAVEVVLAGGLSSRRAGIEEEAVVRRDARDVRDDASDDRRLVGEGACGEVGVSRRPARVVGGEQQAALEDHGADV